MPLLKLDAYHTFFFLFICYPTWIVIINNIEWTVQPPKSTTIFQLYGSVSKPCTPVVGTRLIDGRGVLVIFRSFCRGFYSIFCRCRRASGRFFNLFFLLFRCFFSFL